MKITVYINEESLQGQLCGNVSKAVNNLMAVINTLMSNRNVEISILTSSSIFSKQICAGTGLTIAQLSKSDHDLFMVFKQMLDKGGYWDKIPKQLSGSYYLHQHHKMNGTSVAEARESAESDKEETMIISFPNTYFNGNTLSITKDGINLAVPHAITTSDVFEFLTNKGIPLKYDRTKFLRLDDKQTILADASQFKDTGREVQGRSVYERIGKGEYWYVDNFHKDGSVHLEVFRMSDGTFIGTCDIEDISKFKAASRKEIAYKEPLKF